MSRVLDRDRRAALARRRTSLLGDHPEPRLVAAASCSCSALAGRYRFDRVCSCVNLRRLWRNHLVVSRPVSATEGARLACRRSAALPAAARRASAAGCYFPAVRIHHRRQGSWHLSSTKASRSPSAGSLLIDGSRDRRSVPPGQRDLFFPSAPALDLLRNRGSWVSSSRIPAAGTVVGQFPHLFPASIAIGYGLNGLTGRAPGRCGLGGTRGCSRVYFAGTRIIGARFRRPHTFLLAGGVDRSYDSGTLPTPRSVWRGLSLEGLLAFSTPCRARVALFRSAPRSLFGLQLFFSFRHADRGRFWLS